MFQSLHLYLRRSIIQACLYALTLVCILFLFLSVNLKAQLQNNNNKTVAAPWVPDLGNGNYKNPVIYADYSDPDVIRVDDDFYLVASSFDQIPGLPILHSKDLINWKVIGHALLRQQTYDVYSKTRHGGGI
jgi:hypothetical protein